MKVRIRIQDRDVRASLKQVRRDVDRGVREALRRAAFRHGLPEARRRAPGHIDQALSAGATVRSAWLQLKRRRGDEMLHEFGGDPSKPRTMLRPISPVNREALLTPWGPRARVRRGRYRAMAFMRSAVVVTRPAILRDAEDAVVAELGKHFRVT